MRSILYCGRFAPTPSGPLHFGSLVAALASYLDARAQDGLWLLRVEDVDPPREVKGAAAGILHTLLAHGFVWDGEVVYQSRRNEAYLEALVRLRDRGWVYPCTCSRKLISEVSMPGVDGFVYPGRCRDRNPAAEGALRFRLPAQRVRFTDRLLGQVACNVEQECGDFVLRRADGVITYQLAVVVDDAEQGVTHVVRGADLLTSTPRQIVLQQALGYPTPTYLHVPVVLDPHGCKLSKQTRATALHDDDPLPALRAAGRFLGLPEIGQVAGVAVWLANAIRLWPEVALAPVRGRLPGHPAS